MDIYISSKIDDDKLDNINKKKSNNWKKKIYNNRIFLLNKRYKERLM